MKRIKAATVAVYMILLVTAVSPPRTSLATDNCNSWWIFNLNCDIILCSQTTTTSTNCTKFLAGPSKRKCVPDGNGAKCANMSWTNQNADKYSLTGTLKWEAFSLTAGNSTDKVTTSTVSLTEVTLICSEGPSCIDHCCNAIWMAAQKIVKHKEGWCEWAPPCGEKPATLDCEGTGVLIQITGTATNGDCNYTDPECTTTP